MILPSKLQEQRQGPYVGQRWDVALMNHLLMLGTGGVFAGLACIIAGLGHEMQGRGDHDWLDLDWPDGQDLWLSLMITWDAILLPAAGSACRIGSSSCQLWNVPVLPLKLQHEVKLSGEAFARVLHDQGI